MLRSISAVIAGFAVFFVVTMGVQLVGLLLWPVGDLDFNDAEAVKAAMAKMPIEALLFVVLSHGVGAFAGAATTACVARRKKVIHALFLGGLFVGAGLANLLSLPHPVWFWVVDLAIYLPAAYAGARLVSRQASSSAGISGQSSEPLQQT
jgi:hypothetical protein